jgi:hypothetical protein
MSAGVVHAARTRDANQIGRVFIGRHGLKES